MRGQTLSSFYKYPCAIAVFKNGKLIDWDSVSGEYFISRLIERFRKRYPDCEIWYIKAKRVR